MDAPGLVGQGRRAGLKADASDREQAGGRTELEVNARGSARCGGRVGLEADAPHCERDENGQVVMISPLANDLVGDEAWVDNEELIGNDQVDDDCVNNNGRVDGDPVDGKETMLATTGWMTKNRQVTIGSSLTTWPTMTNDDQV